MSHELANRFDPGSRFRDNYEIGILRNGLQYAGSQEVVVIDTEDPNTVIAHWQPRGSTRNTGVNC